MERNIKLLALLNFFSDFRLFSAILVLYFAKITESYALAMSLVATVMLSSSIFEVPTGIFSDFIGRKKTVIVGTICATLSVVLYAIGVDYWILFAGALFEGFSRAWFSGNNDALLHDSLRILGKHEQYDHYLGRLSSMFQVALAVAVAIGSILASYSFALVMWVSVIPQFFSIITAVFIIEPKNKKGESGNIFRHIVEAIKLFWQNKSLRLLSLQDVISFGIGESTFQFRDVFVSLIWPLWAVGFSKMLSFIGGLVGFWYSGKIIKKIGGIKILLISSIYNRAINLIALIFPTLLSPLLMSTASLWYGVTTVASNALMQKHFTNAQRATMSSLNSLFGSICFGICSLLLGFMADRLGPIRALIIAQVFYASQIFITAKLMRLKS